MNSDSRFYLSTDDSMVQEEFISEYGSHILVREKDFGRNTVVGMQDALVDMWLLSKTTKIFGSYYSSFSRMASLVGCHNLEILKQ